MKTLVTILIFLSVSFIYAQQNEQQQGMRKAGTYQDQADSLRKKHLTPRRNDSVGQSGTDKMPVLNDSNKNNSRMPVARPVPDQHMPVKELSDTSLHK
jgi:hypothetical protein